MKQRSYNTSILAFDVGPDNKNSSMNIAHVYQTGIGLPERDYYFKTDRAKHCYSAGLQKISG